MVIEELAAIIGMQFLHWERQARQDALKAAFHGLLASSEHRSALTPARGHIDELDGMTMHPRCTFAAVIDQVDLEVSWFQYPRQCDPSAPLWWRHWLARLLSV